MDKYCPNFAKDHPVSSQQECQRICVETTGCVGISYSHKDNETIMSCYVCMDDNLTTARNDFGFYRNPGIFDVLLHNTKMVSIYLNSDFTYLF